MLTLIEIKRNRAEEILKEGKRVWDKTDDAISGLRSWDDLTYKNKILLYELAITSNTQRRTPEQLQDLDFLHANQEELEKHRINSLFPF